MQDVDGQSERMQDDDGQSERMHVNPGSGKWPEENGYPTIVYDFHPDIRMAKSIYRSSIYIFLSHKA